MKIRKTRIERDYQEYLSQYEEKLDWLYCQAINSRISGEQAGDAVAGTHNGAKEKPP